MSSWSDLGSMGHYLHQPESACFMQLINVYISNSSISRIHERASGDLLSEDCCALYTSTAVRARQINVFCQYLRFGRYV